MRQVLEVASADIKCSRRCAGQGARIAVGFFSDEIVAPTSQSSYIIVREEELTAPRGAKEGHLSVRPAITQHRTLICEVDAGEGADCLVDVQVRLLFMCTSGTLVLRCESCNTELSRGFELTLSLSLLSLSLSLLSLSLFTLSLSRSLCE